MEYAGAMNHSPLNRTLSLHQMVLYGLGTTIGAGIYALVGEIAGLAGYLAPLAFLVASLLAALTALSFAELCGRFPQAAGAALYTEKGLGSQRLAVTVGLMVCLAGMVSGAALINAFAGYLQAYLGGQREWLLLTTTLLIGALALWGIAESVTVASIITVVEIGGLLLVIGVSSDAYTRLPAVWPDMLPAMDMASLMAVSGGAMLAFYAFIGFEDMVEVAEEVKDVKRTLPRAILLTIVITTVLYLLVMLAAILTLPPATLATSKTPLALVYATQTGHDSPLLDMIGMIAVMNGAIIQMIMASRVLYGLGSRGQLPAILSVVHPRTQTPVMATAVVTGLILLLALTGRLVSLAELTSLIVLGTYSMVNLSLWRLKKHAPRVEGIFHVPRPVPLLAFIVCSGFVLLQLAEYLF